ncbi:DMT family transporter [Janthinobacterium sp. UMAB-56]|uniref:DMT family transporter n=1 Tax=Janthinobacterium sp. UMAB-56 TaxID=1365361 RepID=UPI001C55E816|nr:DMT family transporter [Janthinobacterium sp. UMAB-56]
MTNSYHRAAAQRGGLFAILVLATFLMGSSFIAGKILLADGYPAMLLVGWRFLLAALATLPLVWLQKKPMPGVLRLRDLDVRGVATVMLIGLMQTAAVMGLLFLAMRTVSAATAAILLFTNPLWVAVLGRLFLNEQLHGARIAGLILGIAGVALSVGWHSHADGGGGQWQGEAIGLLSAFCWAAATIINKRANLPLASWSLSFAQMLTGALALLAIAYGLGQRWPAHTSASQWAWFLWLAIPASTGSFGLWFLALKRGGASRTSSFLFLAPLFTVLLSYFILDTRLTWWQGLGAIFICVSLVLVNRLRLPS